MTKPLLTEVQWRGRRHDRAVHTGCFPMNRPATHKNYFFLQIYFSGHKFIFQTAQINLTNPKKRIILSSNYTLDERRWRRMSLAADCCLSLVVTWHCAVSASEWWDPAATLITSCPVRDLMHKGCSLNTQSAHNHSSCERKTWILM